MLANARLLARQGSVASRLANGRRLWLLRFKDVEQGRSVQRALYLGGQDQAEVVQRARDLLSVLRAPLRLSKELHLICGFVKTVRNMMRTAR